MSNSDYLRRRAAESVQAEHDGYPTAEELVEGIKDSFEGHPQEIVAVTREFYATPRLLCVSIDHWFPGIEVHTEEGLRDFDYGLVMPAFPDYLLGGVDDLEDAIEFCNRLGKRAEYHVYADTNPGIQ